MTLGVTGPDHSQQALERRRGMVSQHGYLAIALRREPIELNNTALAGERFVTVP
jgi:hypothetical protein